MSQPFHIPDPMCAHRSVESVDMAKGNGDCPRGKICITDKILTQI